MRDRPALFRSVHARVSAGFVDDIDGLVGQEAVVDMLARQLGSGFQGFFRVNDPVVILVTLAQAQQYLVGFLDRWLGNFDLLKAARQGAVLLKVFLVLLVGGGADAAQFPRGQHRLEDIGSVQRTARHRAGADDRMDFIDEQHGVLFSLQDGQHFFQPFLEIAAVAGSGQQGPHVQGVDPDVSQRRRHPPLHHPLGQALGDGRLADAGIADMDRIVLEAPAKDLQGAGQDILAADQRFALPAARLGGQLAGEHV